MSKASDYPFRFRVISYDGPYVRVLGTEGGDAVAVFPGDLVVAGTTDGGVDWDATLDYAIKKRDTPPLTESRVYIKGDTSLFRGNWARDQFADQPSVGKFYRTEARRHGVSMAGKVYHSTLAEYPGDPRAWVADSSDIRQVLEERGWGSRGDIEVKAREVDPDSPEAFKPKSAAARDEAKMAASPDGAPTPQMPFMP